jgi:hypothetical protein
MRKWMLLPALTVLAGSLAVHAEERIVERERVIVQAPTERDPALGAPLPQGKIYESKKSWKFDDDELEFKNANPNPDGKRYLIWKDYHWIIGDNEITVIDPSPFGTTITSSRNQIDHKGRRLKDEKVMDSLKDQAGEIRRARTPYYDPPVNIGIGFGFGYYGGGPYYGHRHYHGGHYYAPRYYTPRYRYR